jgi:26S proteasome regulatory subunit N8
MEHLRDIKDSTTTTLATHVSEQLASLRGLQSDIQKYLAVVGAGSMSVNQQSCITFRTLWICCRI